MKGKSKILLALLIPIFTGGVLFAESQPPLLILFLLKNQDPQKYNILLNEGKIDQAIDKIIEDTIEEYKKILKNNTVTLNTTNIQEQEPTMNMPNNNIQLQTKKIEIKNLENIPTEYIGIKASDLIEALGTDKFNFVDTTAYKTNIDGVDYIVVKKKPTYQILIGSEGKFREIQAYINPDKVRVDDLSKFDPNNGEGTITLDLTKLFQIDNTQSSKMYYVLKMGINEYLLRLDDKTYYLRPKNFMDWMSGTVNSFLAEWSIGEFRQLTYDQILENFKLSGDLKEKLKLDNQNSELTKTMRFSIGPIDIGIHSLQDFVENPKATVQIKEGKVVISWNGNTYTGRISLDDILDWDKKGAIINYDLYNYKSKGIKITPVSFILK
jgi:hypothetical protein